MALQKSIRHMCTLCAVIPACACPHLAPTSLHPRLQVATEHGLISCGRACCRCTAEGGCTGGLNTAAWQPRHTTVVPVRLWREFQQSAYSKGLPATSGGKRSAKSTIPGREPCSIPQIQLQHSASRSQVGVIPPAVTTGICV